MIRTFSQLLLLSAVSFAALTAQANTYYKWTGSNGEPFYSQSPPTNGVDLRKVQVINERSFGPATSAPAAQTGSADHMSTANMTPEQKRIKELEEQNKLQKAQADKERCKSLQNGLQNLNAGGRVYEMDSKGERKYLDNREIELKRQTLQQAIQQYCK